MNYLVRRMSSTQKCKPPDPPPVDVDALREDWERDLKAKNEELEEVRVKLEQEQDSKQKLQKQLQQLQVSIQDANSKLQRAQDVGEKLRLENKKKTEQVEKLERNISHMEDRIRNLEIRASEVEKAELTLESTRRNLESSQQDCRSKEGEIRRLQDKYDKTCLELEQAQTKIAELEKKIDDLKLQVRHELMKNENIERGLETIPHLKDDIRERDKRISQLETEIDQMSILLAASRKAVREFKDKIRDLEKGEAAGEGMRRELELAQHEVMTLKQLITGKDALLLRKGQALEQAKEIIESLPRTQDEKEKLKKIQQLLTKLADRDISTNPNNTNESDMNGNRGHQRVLLTPRGRQNQDAGRELTVNAAPYSRESGEPVNFLEQCLQDGGTGRGGPTQMAVVHPVRRASSFHEQSSHQPRSRHSPRSQNRNSSQIRPGTSNVYRPETRPGSRFPPSLDYSLGGTQDEQDSWVNVTNHHNVNHSQRKPRPYSATNACHRDTDASSDFGSHSSLDTDSEISVSTRDQQLLAKAQLTARQKDEILASSITIGDRVTFTIPQKPPRYGRKKRESCGDDK
ncbi:hypothetical protein BaRGS_00027101 [Batillaria attramentaria]|uniref:Uncharacterized protein n=1 Tax=Batillaria attramentaria TaxID=370345 RepID=A0ABD0K3U0_9CAEN